MSYRKLKKVQTTFLIFDPFPIEDCNQEVDIWFFWKSKAFKEQLKNSAGFEYMRQDKLFHTNS